MGTEWVVHPHDHVANCCSPASQESILIHIPSSGEDQNSQFKVWFLSHAYCFSTIVKLKTSKQKHRKLEVCNHESPHQREAEVLGDGSRVWMIHLTMEDKGQESRNAGSSPELGKARKRILLRSLAKGHTP